MTNSLYDVPRVRAYLENLHVHITKEISALDEMQFSNDVWKHKPGGKLGGGGCTSILEQGTLFERAGIGISDITGIELPQSASASRLLTGYSFTAIGVSLVLHPRNPYCPTVHMNVRMFIAKKMYETPVFWFGGGMDLTPYYGFEEDAQHFHRTCKLALDPFGVELYPNFKKWCDEYFFLKHRNEYRGIGGIFFDDYDDGGFDKAFDLMRSVGDSFLLAYIPIIKRRRDIPYGERERAFQLYRRGRYVEFNLIFDRGTLFGLHGGGRTESILLSMPPVVHWRYDWNPEPDSPEERLINEFLILRDWII
ncbi:MAG: oxygen-dependent coproporphyrinogen oxidase [Burkholderia sp.]|nr:oxygen-dependent coproporphyrinogen oxidase [Burkholderia sp.]